MEMLIQKRVYKSKKRLNLKQKFSCISKDKIQNIKTEQVCDYHAEKKLICDWK